MKAVLVFLAKHMAAVLLVSGVLALIAVVIARWVHGDADWWVATPLCAGGAALLTLAGLGAFASNPGYLSQDRLNTLSSGLPVLEKWVPTLIALLAPVGVMGLGLLVFYVR